jgi:hypothetical protein
VNDTKSWACLNRAAEIADENTETIIVEGWLTMIQGVSI